MWDEAESAGKAAMLAKGTQVSVLANDQLDQMKAIFRPQLDAAVTEVENQGKPGRKFFDRLPEIIRRRRSTPVRQRRLHPRR